MTILKFTNINFPIFTLETKPYQITYDKYNIYCQIKPNDYKQTVDDKRLSGDYFSRLLQLKARLQFDNTCKNVQELIITKAKWGMDSKAMPHDFSKLVAAPIEIKKIVKTSGNLIWLKNISYPFEIKTKETVSLTDVTYGIIVHINNEWYLKEVSYEQTLPTDYVYV